MRTFNGSSVHNGHVQSDPKGGPRSGMRWPGRIVELYRRGLLHDKENGTGWLSIPAQSLSSVTKPGPCRDKGILPAHVALDATPHYNDTWWV